MLRNLFVCLLLIVGSSHSGIACTALSGASEGLAAINKLRAQSGKGALSSHQGLSAQAQAYACDMATRGYFSHVTPEGRTIKSRLKAAGVSGCGSENIYYGGSIGSAVSTWLASPPHKKNMLGRFKLAGLAGATGGGTKYWVLIVGGC
jgi:uncharacterized protein YkwD